MMLDIWIFTYKRITLDPYLIPYTKINSKWIIDLYVRAKATKQKQGVNIYDFGLGKEISRYDTKTPAKNREK